jgi:hypothetical protein
MEAKAASVSNSYTMWAPGADTSSVLLSTTDEAWPQRAAPDVFRKASLVPTDGEAGAKRRRAPKPRFDARRLTQENDTPLVWKCSDEAKTSYDPSSMTSLPDSARVHAKAYLSQMESSNLSALPARNGVDELDSAPSFPSELKHEYKAWAANFLKNMIVNSKNSGHNTARSVRDTARSARG